MTHTVSFLVHVNIFQILAILQCDYDGVLSAVFIIDKLISAWPISEVRHARLGKHDGEDTACVERGSFVASHCTFLSSPFLCVCCSKLLIQGRVDVEKREKCFPINKHMTRTIEGKGGKLVVVVLILRCDKDSSGYSTRCCFKTILPF